MSTPTPPRDADALARLAADVRQSHGAYDAARADLEAAKERAKAAADDVQRNEKAVSAAFNKADIAQRRLLIYATTGEVMTDDWNPYENKRVILPRLQNMVGPW